MSSLLRSSSRAACRVLVLLALCSGLWSCAWVNPSPPRSVVAEAVAQKVAQTQTALQSQLGLAREAPTSPQPSGIKVTSHHWITLNNQDAVEVEGTYRLKGGGLSWSQQRQARPFSLYLRRVDAEQWAVVEPATPSRP